MGRNDWSTCPPPKFADQLQAFWLALEPAACGARVVWGCSAGAADQKPGKHLEYSHPRMQYVRDWISLQIAQQKIHPQLVDLVANFDQVWSLNFRPRKRTLQQKVQTDQLAHSPSLRLEDLLIYRPEPRMSVLEVRGKQCWFCKLGGMIDECVDLCTHRVLCTVSSTM